MARQATAQAGNKPEPDAAQGPQGRRIDTNLGPGLLYPGVGRIVQRSGQPIYCGAMVGRCFGYIQHPNAKDPSKLSTRFQGQFTGIKPSGEILNTSQAYLPSAIDGPIKAALDIQKGMVANPIEFAVEIWCEPDDRANSSMGFRYGCYDRVKAKPNDPLLMLAYEAGLIDAPQGRLTGPETVEGVDPETGEVPAG